MRKMNTSQRSRFVSTSVLCAIIVGASAATSQSINRRSITVSAGIAEYDLSGTGTVGVGALNASFPITPFLAFDPTIAFLHYDQQFGSGISILMPEIGARFQIPGRIVNPYLAVGGGVALIVEGNGSTDLTLHTAVGTYLWLGAGWAVRPEARIRSIDPFIGVTADLTIGLSRRL